MPPNSSDEEDEELKIIYLIVGTTMHSDDYEEGLNLCRRFSEHESEWVRRAVLEGLSHLSRFYKKMDLEFAVPLLAKGLEDKSRDVSGQADDTLNDFEMFLPGFTRNKHGFVGPDLPEQLRVDDDDDEESAD